MAPLKSVCPVCFKLFPLTKRIPAECGDCGSEAIDVELEPLTDFLARTSLETLEKISVDWQKGTAFNEAYKKTKQERIDHLIELKERFAL